MEKHTRKKIIVNCATGIAARIVDLWTVAKKITISAIVWRHRAEKNSEIVSEALNKLVGRQSSSNIFRVQVDDSMDFANLSFFVCF